MPHLPSLRNWILLVLQWALLGGGLTLSLGCGVILSTATVSNPQSILKAVKPGPQRVTLEIFQVRIPANEEQLTSELWQAADEQRLDLSLRNRLVSNGLRVGVLNGAVPDSLARSLNLQSETPEETLDRVIDDQTANPQVTRRVLQVKCQEPAIVQVADVQPQVHVLVNSDNGLQGRTYDAALGVYSLQADVVPGQQIAIQLTPELQYGQFRNRYLGGDQGAFLVSPSQERQIFDQIKMEVQLAAGEILVVSGVQGAPASLGSVLHTIRQTGSDEQKLLLIRVLQVPQSEILAQGEPGA
jgi:hypothetical protein